MSGPQSSPSRGQRPRPTDRGGRDRRSEPADGPGFVGADQALPAEPAAGGNESRRRSSPRRLSRRAPAAGAVAGPARRSTGGGMRMRRIGTLSLLLPAAPAPAESLAGCLEQLRRDWEQQGHEAALWQAWPNLAGPQLAPHCRPLQLSNGLLCIGAPPGPWLQALQYNRHQLLGALRAAGFNIRDLRFQQHHPGPARVASSGDEAATWARHPSRIDVHGLADCPDCQRPAPAGEMALWGHCGFCRRAHLAAQGPPPAAEPPPEAGPPEPGSGTAGSSSGPQAASSQVR